MNRDTFLNVLFPRRCPVCGEITEPAGSLICRACYPRLSPVKSPVCKICGREVLSSAEELCRDCARRRPSFSYGMALFNYNETAKRSLAKIKSGNKREYLDFYGAAMAARFGKAVCRMRADALVPVPIHPSRRRARGFNQAEVLADEIGRRLDVPVYPNLLVRTKKTAPQKELSAAERLKNLSGAFAFGRPGERRERVWFRLLMEGRFPDGKKPPAVPETVILVDDIYTTGSTMEACARVLLENGVKNVYFLAVCITGGR